MDIRLDIKILALGIFFSIQSCRTKIPIEEHRVKIPVVGSNDDVLLKEFKRTFLIKCIENGFNETKLDSLIHNDVSLMGDFPLGIEAYKTIEIITDQAKQKIQLDSTKLATRRTYERGKKRVFQVCLDMYESAYVDSIASGYSKKK